MQRQATGDRRQATTPKRVALVCDWLTGIGGAERVVLELHKMFPEAPIYTSQYDPGKIDWFKNADVRTTWLQKLPKGFKKLLPVLRSWSFSRLNLSKYDLVISASGAEAKFVKTHPGAKHIAYIHAPTHYYWSRYEDYLKHPGFGAFDWLGRLGLKVLVGPLRRWDYKAAQRPDVLIANSTHTQATIKKYYGRDSVVVHPPVEIERFQAKSNKQKVIREDRAWAMQAGAALGAGENRQGDVQESTATADWSLQQRDVPESVSRVADSVGQQTDAVHRSGFVVAGRQTPYKRIDLAVAACTKLNLPLTVIGTGPDHTKLVKMAGPTITFDTTADDTDIANYFRLAEAFIFPGIDDFGIVAVEALAAGTPVIAYKAGGALDYVVEGQTGLFFDEQTPESLAATLQAFHSKTFDHQKITEFTQQFSPEEFCKKIQNIVSQNL